MVPAFEPEAAITFYKAFLKHQLPNEYDEKEHGMERVSVA